MKKTILLFIFLFLAPISYAKNTVQMSVPKSGTHLLAKCIRSLTNGPAWTGAIDHFPADFYIATQAKFNRVSQNEKHWVNHLFFNKEFIPHLKNNNAAFFFIYRDPRDMVISMAYYMLVATDNWPNAQKLSMDERIMALITSGKIYNNTPPCKNINDLYQKYLPWMEAPHVCVLKFEDIVGPQGGGNLEAQLNSVQKIANHLGLSLSDNQILEKANTLFGSSGTFRKGQIGAWKKHFNEDHKIAFKEIAGQLLIDLGYEKSFDW